jgi:hypothetical protein
MRDYLDYELIIDRESRSFSSETKNREGESKC